MNKVNIILCGFLMLSTNNAWATELKIKVNNVEVERGGQIIVMIFSEEGFPIKHEKAIFTQLKPMMHETMEFSFDLELEEFAVKILHDDNADGKVTKNWTGIYPREGLGFSNGQKISLTGPPKYKNSKVLKEQSKGGLNISIIYP